MDIIIFDRDGDVTECFAATGLKTMTGDARDVRATAVVSPANSFGFMDGGIDYAYSAWLGWHVQERVQREIASLPFGELLVGQALAVETDGEHVPFLIAAPTMRVPKRITDPADVMLATRAAVALALSRGFDSIAIPGMGTGCGGLSPSVAAAAMQAGILQALSPLAAATSWREAQRRHFNLIGGA